MGGWMKGWIMDGSTVNGSMGDEWVVDGLVDEWMMDEYWVGGWMYVCPCACERLRAPANVNTHTLAPDSVSEVW